MFKFNSIVRLLIVNHVICSSSSFSIKKQFDSGLNTIGGSIDQSQCGGPLEADMDFLAFPRPGQSIQPGQMCVWTIHLPTTNAFELSLPTLNINSTTGCTDGSLRIYSLTNLVSTENLESYTFCDESQPPETFYITESVVAVVFYAGSNPSSFTRFTLSWAGIAFSPVPITHVTSYSSSSNGLIRFPLENEYEPSTIATWLVKAGQIDEELNLDLNLTSLSVEDCTNADDPCVCDALILYEITNYGVLSESDRFCGERSSAIKESISANFIVAFYSDLNSISGSGNGFELQYKPISDPATTTTLEPTQTPPTQTPTPTTEQPAPSTPCGTTIDIEVDNSIGFVEGRIFYKANESFSSNERCVWTIRSNKKLMQVRLEEEGFESSNEQVIIDFFEYFGNPQNGNHYEEPYTRTIIIRNTHTGVTWSETGSLTIVSFVTAANSTGTGFVLWYRSSGPWSIEDTPNHTDLITDQSEGAVMQGEMDNFMMSSFVIPPTNYVYDPLIQRSFVIHLGYLEPGSGKDEECHDSLRLYKFTPYGLSRVNEYCGSIPYTIGYETADTFVMILKSDLYDLSNGFNMTWTSGPVMQKF